MKWDFQTVYNTRSAFDMSMALRLLMNDMETTQHALQDTEGCDAKGTTGCGKKKGCTASPSRQENMGSFIVCHHLNEGRGE